MPGHEWFEELCALAAVGQVTEGELAVLQSHLRECPSCGQLNDQFVAIGALCLSQERHAESDAAYPQTEIRQRVLRDLQGAGARFSSSLRKELAPKEKSFPTFDFISVFRQRTTWAYVAAIILVGIIGFAAGSYRYSYLSGKQAVAAVQPSPAAQDTGSAVPDKTIVPTYKADVKESASTTNEWLEKLKVSEAVRKTTENELAALKAKVANLQDTRDRDAAEIAQLRSASESDRKDAELAGEQLRKLEDKQSTANADLVAAQYQIRDLETKLSQQSAAAERERQMLLMASSSEMRDVIGSRNLHIIDVADVDNRGPKKPFGRVFYTEGKSLIFFAYDLANTKGSQTFYAWGQRGGNPTTTHALGVLMNDDQTQRRWVFRCNDSKVLAQIDSVYVTLEPSDRPGGKPKGKRLLNAYLGTPANHP